MKCSKRINGVGTSPVRKLIPYAEEAKKNGKKIYHLNIGQPDIKTPDIFFDAVKNYKKEVLTYVSSRGIPELVKAIQNYYKDYGMDFEEEEILVTCGGSEALQLTLLTLLDAGETVLVAEPYYANYNTIFKSLELNVAGIPTKAEDGFHLPKKEVIEEVIKKNPTIKAILLPNPGNPTGTVYTKEEIEMIADIAIEHDIAVIADEVYREFVYDFDSCTSFGTIDRIYDRLVIIDSISKRYSACGARIGCMISKDKEFLKQVYKMCQSRLSVAELEQVGAAALYTTPDSYLKEVNEEYRKRRDVLYAGLSKIEGVVCSKPEGAFYSMVKLPVDSSEKFIIWLLENFDVDGETVMMAPGDGFYATEGMGVNEVRIAYVLKEEDLKKAINILDKGLMEYPGRTI
ncbi:pyridoxal phosphate-dependent aminotransferase [Clostridium sp. DL1XJH146]